MRNILVFIVFSVIPITAILFHLWTVVIAFSEGGILSGIITLILPVLAEIYWMVKMWGVNDTYITLGIIHLIGVLSLGLLK